MTPKQRRIPRVEIAPNWTTVAGAIAGVLTAVGERVSPAWVMGVTGHAFRLALTEAEGVLAAAPAAAAAGFATMLPLYGNTGRAFDLIDCATTAPDYPEQRAAALARIRAAIDRDRPVPAYDLHLPEWGIIHGYDDRSRALVVSTLMSGQYGNVLAEERWPAPERPSRLVVLLTGDRTRPEPRQAVTDALAFAVRYAEAGDPNDPTAATHGLAAFARWRSALTESAPLDAAGHARTIVTVETARRDAARFLREATRFVTTPAATALEAAAAAYDAAALACSRLATLFPYPAGGDVTNQGMRLAASAALRTAEAHERAALDHLRTALTAQ
jgi:hypothetical protein